MLGSRCDANKSLVVWRSSDGFRRSWGNWRKIWFLSGRPKGTEMGWALVAISHCMSLQTAGQESNRTTVFWWWVHSMLGNDFDIFWWVIYSAKFNFDLMPVLWRCVFLFIDWFGCHSRVSLQALLVSFPNKPMRVPAASTAMGEAFWPSPCQARLKRKSDGKRWIWRFWMLIISYIYI